MALPRVGALVVGDVIRYDIKEISAAPFVAAEADESTDVTNNKTKLRSLLLCDSKRGGL